MNRCGESHHRHVHKHYRRDARRVDRHRGKRSRTAFRRRYFSREERIAGLELYLNDLRAEAQAVEEKLARLAPAG